MEAVDLLTDFVGRPRIDADELDRERGVVIQEIQRSNDQPSRVAEQADRPRRVRRPPARPPRARPRGAPAHLHPRGDPRLPRAPLGGRARRRVPRRQPRALPANGAVARAASAASRAARRREPYEPAPPFSAAALVEQRDTNQSHLRMIYRPRGRRHRPRAARRARDLLDAARRLDGLAPVRRDPRAARPLLLGLRASTTRFADVPILQLGGRARLEQVRRGIRADAGDRRRAARRRPDRGGGRARAGLRGRPPCARIREHERGRAPRGRAEDRLRRGHRPRRGDRRARRRDRSTRSPRSRGRSRSLSIACVGPHSVDEFG